MKEYVVVITHNRALILLSSAAALLLSIGVALLIATYGTEFCEVRYKIDPLESGLLEFSHKACPRFPSKLNGQYALYYKLDGYYQNHKEFRRSIDYTQLFGNIVEHSSSISSCRPFTTDDTGRILHPCGALPHHVFADRFTVFRDRRKEVEIELDESRKAICNRWGVHTLFRNPTSAEMSKYGSKVNFWMTHPEVRKNLSMDKEGVGEGVLNAHFINWVDISSTSTVKKLYGLLNAEEILLPIYVNVDVATELPNVVHKSVIIEKLSTLGRIGRAMGVMYVIVAMLIALLTAIAFVHSPWSNGTGASLVRPAAVDTPTTAATIPRDAT